MNRFFNWQILLVIFLITLSLVFYEIEYLVFGDPRHIAMYFLQDLAFVFVEVLLVTIVIHRLLAFREKRALMKKMNMVIGAFFSEVGTGLIRHFRAFDTDPDGISRTLKVSGDWTAKDFVRAGRASPAGSAKIDCSKGSIGSLKEFLLARRQFLLGLLENANLLEHESFTELLWAVFHLTEELDNRNDLGALPAKDLDHLAGDIKRAYAIIVSEWVAYMGHLKADYPYLFSLAVRTNPFNPEASAVVR